jgi:hypothetical protein
MHCFAPAIAVSRFFCETRSVDLLRQTRMSAALEATIVGAYFLDGLSILHKKTAGELWHG